MTDRNHTQTPETDTVTVEAGFASPDVDYVPAEFARSLERRLRTPAQEPRAVKMVPQDPCEYCEAMCLECSNTTRLTREAVEYPEVIPGTKAALSALSIKATPPLAVQGGITEAPVPALFIGTKLVPYEDRQFHTEGLAEKLGYSHNVRKYYSEEQMLAALSRLSPATTATKNK